MEAIRRPNRVVEGAKPMEAVLDIVVPFLRRGRSPHHRLGQSKYTRYQPQCVCLHSSNLSVAMQYNNGNCALRPGRAGKKEAAGIGGLQRSVVSSLFGGNLPRRIERAGIVDLRHLVVGTTQNLSQDLVGMFAEQG